MLATCRAMAPAEKKTYVINMPPINRKREDIQKAIEKGDGI